MQAVRHLCASSGVRALATYALGGASPSIDASAWVAPSADVIGDVNLKENSSVWFNATIRGDNAPITIGANSNVQDGSVLHTDDGVPLDLGKDCTVGHMVMLHGCTIGDNSLIGIGTVVLNNVKGGVFVFAAGIVNSQVLHSWQELYNRRKYVAA
jgi:carbonic anhydrase/acetyltransferase-like protein (isoleucine patch superfamily)